MNVPKCFKCNEDIQVIMHWINYCKIDEVGADGLISVGDVDDAVPDDDRDLAFFCAVCGDRRGRDGGNGLSKFDVEIALLFSQPESYELFQFVVDAYDEEDAAKVGEEKLEEQIEASEGNTHNVAGFHLWGVREHEPEMEEAPGELPAEG